MSGKLSKIERVKIPVYVEGAFLIAEDSIEPVIGDLESTLCGGVPFPSSSTGMNYQQLNWLEKNHLLPFKGNPDERGWRKFSFSEIVYLNIVSQLREFGVKNAQLSGLCDLVNDTPAAFEQAILACLNSYECGLLLYADGTGYLASRNYILEAEEADDEAVKRPHIRLLLNQAVNNALVGIGKDPVKVLHTLGEAIRRFRFTEKEQKILDAVRNNNYYRLEITKNSGEPSLIYAYSNEIEMSLNNKSANLDVTLSLLSHDFSKIEVAVRDGKISHVVVRDTIKL